MHQLYTEVTYDVFMKQFVAGEDAPDHISEHFYKFEGADFQVSDEKRIYPIIAKGIHSVLSGSDLVVKDTGDWPEMQKEHDMRKVDMAIYPNGPQKAVDAYTLDSQAKENVSLARRPYTGRTSWTWMLVPIEVKVDLSKRGFGISKDEDFLTMTDNSLLTRGQIAEYAAEILFRQHREFLFSVIIFKDVARLLRWDRVGVVVSEPFNFQKSPMTFLNFFYRLSRMTRPEDRGIDPTAKLAAEVDIETMRALIPGTTGYINEYVKEGLDNKDWPIYNVEVANPSEDIGEGKGKGKGKSSEPPATRHFLIGKHRKGDRYPCGRATRGYIAFDLQDKRFVFLKDSWRVNVASSHPEFETYQRLKEKGVKYVADAICGGDVGSQRTLSQRYIKSPTFAARLHYRIVIRQIGRPLSGYANGYELCSSMFYALLAHQDAYDNAQVLHHDISDGNILIDDNADDAQVMDGKKVPQGFLIDWDLCKWLDKATKGASRVNRSGTWRFMSALVLNYPLKEYELSDDIESFVHVINLFALRFHSHNLSSALQRHITQVYDHCEDVGDYDVGSPVKLENMRRGYLGFTLNGHETLRGLINSLMDLCRTHYRAVNWIDLERRKPVNQDIPAPAGAGSEMITQRIMLPNAKASKKPSVISKPMIDLEPETGLKGLVLNTHEHMIDVFLDAIGDSTKWPKKDRTPDQFALFPARSWIPFGSNSQYKSKRTSSDADLDGSEQQQKKSRSGSRTKSMPQRKAKNQRGPSNGNGTHKGLSAQLDPVAEADDEQ